MGWFSKPTEKELYEKCRQAETAALKARGDAEVFEPTAAKRNAALSEKIVADAKDGLDTEAAVKELATIINDIPTFLEAWDAAEARLADAAAARDDTAGEPNNSKRYLAAAGLFDEAKAQYKTAQQKGSAVEKAYARGLTALETARRNHEKKNDVKKEAAKLAVDVATMGTKVAAEAFISVKDRSRFLTPRDAGIKAYSDGKGGYYQEAVDRFNEALQAGREILHDAAARRAAYEEGTRRLDKLAPDIAEVQRMLADPDKAPHKIRLYVKGNGGPMVDPSRFESRSHGLAVALRDFDYDKALKTDIPALEADIARARDILDGIEALKAKRADALAGLEDDAEKVMEKAAEVLALVTSEDYAAGWESFKAAEGRDPEVGDLSGVTSLVESTRQAAALKIGNTMTADDIKAEQAAFAQTLAFAVDGIEAIRREAKYLIELQREVTSEKAEARARVAFEGLRPEVADTVRQLDLWQWDGAPDAIKTLRDLDAKVPKATPWTKGLPVLEALAEKVRDAHASRRQEVKDTVDSARGRKDELAAKAKEAFDALHKDLFFGKYATAEGDEILARLREEIALLDAFDLTPPADDSSGPDYSYLNAAGLNAMADSIAEQIDRLKNTKKEDFAALTALKKEIEEILGTDPFKSIQPTKRTEMKADFQANVWTPAQKMEVEPAGGPGSGAETANKTLRDFKTKATGATAQAETINRQRETAKTKGREAEKKLESWRKLAKAAAIADGEEPVDTLRGGFVSVYDDLVAFIKMKDYEDDADKVFPAKVKALEQAFKPIEDAADKGRAALARHKEALAAADAAAKAMIDWKQKCELTEADIDRLKAFLTDHPEGDPSEADRLKKNLRNIKKMVKNADNPSIGEAQITAIQREIADLREHPRNLRAPAMEAIKTATETWRKGVDRTHANLDKLAGTITAKVGGNDAYKEKVQTIVTTIERVKDRLDAGVFDDVSTVLRDVKLPRNDRRKIKERGLRDARAVRALWDDPAVKRLMFNPFGVKGVFSDAYKALDVMEFELVRFPV